MAGARLLRVPTEGRGRTGRGSGSRAPLAQDATEHARKGLTARRGEFGRKLLCWHFCELCDARLAPAKDQDSLADTHHVDRAPALEGEPADKAELTAASLLGKGGPTGHDEDPRKRPKPDQDQEGLYDVGSKGRHSEGAYTSAASPGARQSLKRAVLRGP